MKKVNLILIDGMRPDALLQCGNPWVQELLSTSAYTLDARVVFPPLTLPCHISLFHSVDTERHGVTGSVFSPMARPVNGILEQLRGRRTSAMCYSWEELRDLGQPGSCSFSFFMSGDVYGYEQASREIAAVSEKLLHGMKPDFCFTYLGWVDEQGHHNGWMSPEYMRAVDGSIALARGLVDGSRDEYITILTADHGGHAFDHGERVDEDMTVPVIIHGEGIRPGALEGPASILDLAPTIVRLLDCEPASEWEGRPLV